MEFSIPVLLEHSVPMLFWSQSTSDIRIGWLMGLSYSFSFSVYLIDPTEGVRGIHYFFFFNNVYYFIFGCAGPSLLCWLFSACGEWGLLSSCGRNAWTYHHGLSCCGFWALEQRLGSCSAWTQLLCCMGHLGSRTEPVSPALAGRFFTTKPSGKSRSSLFFITTYLLQEEKGMYTLYANYVLIKASVCG